MTSGLGAQLALLEIKRVEVRMLMDIWVTTSKGTCKAPAPSPKPAARTRRTRKPSELIVLLGRLRFSKAQRTV